MERTPRPGRRCRTKVTIETLELGDPGPDEVVVHMVGVGAVCGAHVLGKN